MPTWLTHLRKISSELNDRMEQNKLSQRAFSEEAAEVLRQSTLTASFVFGDMSRYLLTAQRRSDQVLSQTKATEAMYDMFKYDSFAQVSSYDRASDVTIPVFVGSEVVTAIIIRLFPTSLRGMEANAAYAVLWGSECTINRTVKTTGVGQQAPDASFVRCSFEPPTATIHQPGKIQATNPDARIVCDTIPLTLPSVHLVIRTKEGGRSYQCFNMGFSYRTAGIAPARAKQHADVLSMLEATCHPQREERAAAMLRNMPSEEACHTIILYHKTRGDMVSTLRYLRCRPDLHPWANDIGAACAEIDDYRLPWRDIRSEELRLALALRSYCPKNTAQGLYSKLRPAGGFSKQQPIFAAAERFMSGVR